MEPKPAAGRRASQSVKALVQATRAQNLLLAAAGTVTGALAGGASLSLDASLYGLGAAALVGALGTAGGNLLNDLVDHELDRQAHPKRPLPSGRLHPRLVAIALLVSFAAAVVLALAFNPWAGLLATLLVVLLLLYETRLKTTGLPGNFTIALAAGALFPLGALVTHGSLYAPSILGALAALAHLGRELLKDAQDAAADAAHRRTLAVTHGPRVATRWASGALIVAVLLSPLPVLVLDWHPVYLALVAPAVFFFALAALTGGRDPRRAQRLAKLAMVAALVAFLIGARI